MTSAEQVLKHFAELPAGTTVDWIIERFLACACDAGSLSIEIPHSEPPRLEATLNGRTASDSGRPGLRLFRTMLARMAKMAADEGGSKFEPYGGHLVFHRAGTRIETEFENTTVDQRFSMIAIPASPTSNLGSESHHPAVSGAG